MDDWWQWGSPSIYSFLNPKKLVFGSKMGNFEYLKIFKSASLLRLWCPYYASPRPGRCLCAERNSRRWFWVLNSLCTMSGSQDMGRQSFFSEFWKMQFLSFESILMCLYHQNGTQWHQLISYGKQWSLWSFWGHLTGKQLVLSLKLPKNTTEKAKIRQTRNRPFFRANLSYKLPSKD